MLTKQGLMKVRTKALRKGVWFKALSRIERSIVDLTIRCVEKIRSEVLAKTVLTIIQKILRTLECNFVEKAEKIGREIAKKVCSLAAEWGNLSASTWMNDLSFARFLGVNEANA